MAVVVERRRGFAPAPPEEVQAVKELYEQDLTYREIGERLGLTIGQINARLERLGSRRTRHEAAQLTQRRWGRVRDTELATRHLRFGSLLAAYRVRDRRLIKDVARDSGVDCSYLTRLEMSDRHPSLSVVIRLADALNLCGAERGRLLVAAGYSPDTLDEWRPSLEAVMRTAQVLDGEQLAQFEAQVTKLAAWWRAEAQGSARSAPQAGR